MQSQYGSSGSGALIPVRSGEEALHDESSFMMSTDDHVGLDLDQEESAFQSYDIGACYGSSQLERLPGKTFGIKCCPAFSGDETWFTFEKDVHDWADITNVDAAKRGVMLRLALRGNAVLYKDDFEIKIPWYFR